MAPSMQNGVPAGGLVTVFGGSGFVGRHVVRALAKRGWRIRVAVRRPDLAGHLQPMGAVGQIHAIQANLRYPQSVAAAVAGADAVVNCVGILQQSGHQTFEEIHDEGAHTIAKAAQAAGVKQFVQISALGADAQGSSTYAVTKAKGEAAVLHEMPGAVILRPSVIFGPEDQFFNRFAALAQRSPALPAIGSGVTKFQPVFVGDVALAVAAALEGQAKPGTVYELGGPEAESLSDILRRVARYAGRDSKPFPIPFIAAKAMAIGTLVLPGGLRPFTFDQVRLLESGDNVVSTAAQAEGRTLAGLGILDPVAMDAVVPAYLERFKPKGQFSHYRN
jgi:uncharacterized protein YbjT (DUF2867 family)